MSKLDLRASRFAAETGATEGKDMRPLAWGTPQRDLLENKPGLSWCVNPALSWAASGTQQRLVSAALLIFPGMTARISALWKEGAGWKGA